MKNIQRFSKFDDLRFNNGSKKESPMFEKITRFLTRPQLEDTHLCLVQFYQKMKSMGNSHIF